MSGTTGKFRRGMTLIEILVVLSLLALLAVFFIPNYIREVQESRLLNSAYQLRSMIYLTRTHAMLDGIRYRLRFVDAENYEGDSYVDPSAGMQPLVERESNDPESYGEFLPSTETWTRGITLYEGIRCISVQLGRPTFRDDMAEAFGDEDDEEFESNDSVFAELVFEPDGTCDWATFVLTNADEELSLEDISSEEDFDAETLQVIVDGRIGQAWIQRYLTDDEESLLKEYGLRPVLRQDFLSTRRLTEDDVRQISEGRTRR